jgi:hypothetical protein
LVSFELEIYDFLEMKFKEANLKKAQELAKNKDGNFNLTVIILILFLV